MSYILEALRKADEERDQGVAPALPEPAPAEPSASARGGVWRWIAAGAAIPVVALLAWRMATQQPEPAPSQRRAAPAASAAAAPAAVASAASVAGATPAVEQAADVELATVPQEAPASKPSPAEAPVEQTRPPATEAPVEQPQPPVAAKPARAATSRSAREEAAGRIAPPAAAPPAEAAPRPERIAPAAAAPPPADAAKLAKLEELPEELRRQVPAIALGGSVYSPRAEDRMLIVNGQVVREGTELAPGLRVESIGRRSAVLSIRGRRFEIAL